MSIPKVTLKHAVYYICRIFLFFSCILWLSDNECQMLLDMILFLPVAIGAGYLQSDNNNQNLLRKEEAIYAND